MQRGAEIFATASRARVGRAGERQGAHGLGGIPPQGGRIATMPSFQRLPGPSGGGPPPGVLDQGRRSH
jgi:hypothetical protein